MHLHTTPRPRGLTILDVLIVVCIACLLVSVAIPPLIRARRASQLQKERAASPAISQLKSIPGVLDNDLLMVLSPTYKGADNKDHTPIQWQTQDFSIHHGEYVDGVVIEERY